jgi:hypothetical protein
MVFIFILIFSRGGSGKGKFSGKFLVVFDFLMVVFLIIFILNIISEVVFLIIFILNIISDLLGFDNQDYFLFKSGGISLWKDMNIYSLFVYVFFLIFVGYILILFTFLPTSLFFVKLFALNFIGTLSYGIFLYIIIFMTVVYQSLFLRFLSSFLSRGGPIQY